MPDTVTRPWAPAAPSARAQPGLPAGSVSTGYDSSGDPVSLTSNPWPYVAQLSYTELGQPQTYRMGPTTSPVYTSDTYDPQTGNLDTTVTQAGSTPVTVDEDVYHYDDAGQITAADDGGTGITPENQCYAYNYAGELTSAWSQDTTSCAATPSAGILGGAYPYWQQLTYDSIGNVTEDDTTTGAPGAQTVTSDTSSYGGTTGAAGPHQLASQQVTTSTAGGRYV